MQGSDAVIEATVVRSTLPNAQGTFGRGIQVQHDPTTGERASAAVDFCVVEQNQEAGVFVSSSDAMIQATIVRYTAAAESDKLYGDGITVIGGKVTIQNSDVTHNDRAGVSNFGGQVVITGSVITCNAFDLDGEPLDNMPFSFDGSMGYQCSATAPAACTTLGDCHTESTGLVPPPDLPPVDPVKP